MKAVNITLPDGSQRQYDPGVTPQKIAESIGRRLAEATIAAKVNGKEVDVSHPIDVDSTVALITRDSREGLDVIRHSTAHLLAHAIKELYPGAQITIGPVIEDGFYYDIDMPVVLTPDDLPKIEKRMEEIAARKLDVTRTVQSKKEAAGFFRDQKEIYKAEIIDSIPEATVSLYSQGEFTDLCRGPHVPNTGKLGKFKLLSIAGAYWRGDEKNKMLTRIYGTAFATQKELDEHLKRLEEAKKRDHRKVGPELGLFTFLPVAPAMPFYLPKGTTLINTLIGFMRQEVLAQGYQEVICPQLMNTQLWKTSGHWYHYRDNMFVIESESEEQTMGVKPMNCPGHCALFASAHHSYKELPIRYAEFTRLHRNERAGVTHGLLRTRAFAQDDGHIFCSEDHILPEAKVFIEHLYKVYRQFGFSEVEVRLATRPEKFMGEPATWDKAEKALGGALDACGVKYLLAPGEGAFYGPKIEFHIKDSIGRLWQCGTLQLDYQMPESFQLEYIDNESKAQRPLMMHRAVLGSFERFMGILVEHHNGHLPVWIAPVQVVLINVNDEVAGYARSLEKTLKEWKVRVETDLRNEKLGYRIREAQLQRIPLMVVLGNKELENKTLSVRKSSGETVNDLTLDGFRKFLEPLMNPGGTDH